MNLEQSKILITGGSQGIGLETAKVLKKSGAEVCITARSKHNLEKVAEEYGFHAIPCDVGVESEVTGMVEEAVSLMSGLDVLINNAAYGYFSYLNEIDLKSFEEMLQTNLVGAMLVGRECSKHFITEEKGNIVNISSTAGLKGFPGGTAYVASKFALRGMTECWRAELRKYNVRVMLVNPSEVQTNFPENSGREKREFNPSKLQAEDIAYTIKSMLEMNDRGFITESTVWATNPQ